MFSENYSDSFLRCVLCGRFLMLKAHLMQPCSRDSLRHPLPLNGNILISASGFGRACSPAVSTTVFLNLI